ncbi:MAG TPA: HEAT repeat domain-containing protein [Gemmataceae bacterium]|jgi:HEAT repeat protein|nr:HEAT repeat domain-containing protein [Gemmataceae bacterium]
MLRSRVVLLSLVVLSQFAAFAPAQAPPPTKVLEKTADEWIAILKEHKTVKFRRASLIALGVFGPKTSGVLPAVIEALDKDADPQVRTDAAMLLGRMGVDAKLAVPSLADALVKDKEATVREAAARALGGDLNKFADEQLRALVEALGDKSDGTRTAAAEALMKLGDKAAPVYGSILALAKDRTKDRFSRQYALRMLSRLGPDRHDAAEVLAQVLADKKTATPLREEAADGLGRLTAPVALVIPPLAESLSDPAVEIRRAAAIALVRQKQDAKLAWPKVQAAIKDADPAVRYQLIRVAGNMAKESPESIVLLVDEAKKDANIENRLAAIQELGQLAPYAAQIGPVLTDLATNDTEAVIRAAADAAMKKLAGG